MTAGEMKDVLADAVSGAMVAGFEAGRSSGAPEWQTWHKTEWHLSSIGSPHDDGDGPEESLTESSVEAQAQVSPVRLPAVANFSPLSESQSELSQQRSLVAELSLEVAQLSAELKLLREELKTQIQVLAEMEPGGARGSQPSRQSDSRKATAQSPHSLDGDMNNRPGPPDPAGDAPISQAFTISPGVLEKLAGQGVETVAELEAYMRSGQLVPKRVKGIGQIAIDKIRDGLLDYRVKNPIPTWDDFQKDDLAPEKPSDESASTDLGSAPLGTTPPAAETRHLASAIPQDNPPTGQILEVFAVDQIIPMLDELIAEEERLDREGDDEESFPEGSEQNETAPGSSASGALPEPPADPEGSPDPASSSQEPVAAVPSIASGERLEGQSKKQVGLSFRDGTPVDMLQYAAGRKAAQEMEDAGANPNRQGTILWQSWDLGWQRGQ